MNTMELQINALTRLFAATEETEHEAAREELRRLMSKAPRAVALDPEYHIRQLLLELGSPEHLVGHPYVVQAVLLSLNDRRYIDGITFRLYPQLAATFDTTAARVERAIRHLIEVTWTRGDLKTLDKLFGNTVNPNKGRPTNGEFLARMVNIVKQRLREAA